MLNPSLNIEAVRQEFDANKVVVISDFLEPTYAERLWQFLDVDMPQSWWYAAIRPVPVDGHLIYLQNTPEAKADIDRYAAESQKFCADGSFSYYFYRSVNNHIPNCNCEECDYKRNIDKPEMKDAFSKMSGYQLTLTGEVFSSCYKTGCYLSAHHDKDKGKIGFILNLSKDWIPQYGGCLQFLEDDWKTVKRVITPKFNSLVMFDIPSYNGVPHFVSAVAPAVKKQRIAISGWYH